MNKSANMYFRSQSSCKILVCCLKFKQDVRCITKLDCAEGCVSTYPERPGCSAGTSSQESLELLRMFSKSNLTRCHDDLRGTSDCHIILPNLRFVMSKVLPHVILVRRVLGRLCVFLITVCLLGTKGIISSF